MLRTIAMDMVIMIIIIEVVGDCVVYRCALTLNSRNWPISNLIKPIKHSMLVYVYLFAFSYFCVLCVFCCL